MNATLGIAELIAVADLLRAGKVKEFARPGSGMNARQIALVLAKTYRSATCGGSFARAVERDRAGVAAVFSQEAVRRTDWQRKTVSGPAVTTV